MSTTITTAYHILVEENNQTKTHPVKHAVSLVFSSKLSSWSTVSMTTNSHVLVVSHVELKT